MDEYKTHGRYTPSCYVIKNKIVIAEKLMERELTTFPEESWPQRDVGSLSSLVCAI